MKKILFVDNNLHIGGVQKSFVALLQEIEKDYDITLVLFHCDGELLSEIPKSIKIIPAHGLCILLGSTQQQAQKQSVIHGFIRGCSAIFSKIIGNHIPVRLIVGHKIKHDDFDYAISFLHFSPKHLFYGGTNEYILNNVKAKVKISFVHCDITQHGADLDYVYKKYRQFDRIAVCAESCRKKFLTAMPDLRDKTFTVRNCNTYDQIMAAASADPLIYETNCYHVITVARLSEEKELGRGIEAVANCIRNGISITYHLVGDGPERTKLEAYAEKLGIRDHVIFHGMQKNPYRFMKNADLLLLPSRHEAAPMVFDEARCLGLPVLTTETCSAREMIADADAGWVCENSMQGVCSELKRILSNPELLYTVRDKLQKQTCDNTKAIQQFYAMLKGEQ